MKTLTSDQAGIRPTCFGHAVFACALAGLGVIGLAAGDFAYVWQPVPPWVPRQPALADASSALLLGCGAALLWPRMRARMSLVLALCGLSSMLLVHVPRIVAKPEEEVRWYGLGEIGIVVAGAWILFASAAPASTGGWRRAVAGERGARLARLLFAGALLPIGLSHFVYVEVTAKLVPSWLPGPFAFAYLTGTAHLAAALALLAGILPRLAAALEALMVSTFVLTVHVPDVVRHPGGHEQWSELLVACTVGGAAFLLAGSLRGTPWLAMRVAGSESSPHRWCPRRGADLVRKE